MSTLRTTEAIDTDLGPCEVECEMAARGGRVWMRTLAWVPGRTSVEFSLDLADARVYLALLQGAIMEAERQQAIARQAATERP